MKKIRFSVSIKASQQHVWDTLWGETTFREWAGIIDPGTYMVGELAEGSEVQFISSENGYGVTSLVHKSVPGKLLILKHHADTKDFGIRNRAEEWSGGEEIYELTERRGETILAATFDVPLQMEGYFQNVYPKALERVKVLAER